MISVAALVAAGIAPTQAKAWAAPLAAACEAFKINTPPRIAAFVSQCAHESQGFTRLEESLFYTTPERIRQMWPKRVPTMQAATALIRNPQALANVVYAGRNGNGDGASGDGWRYRGRGLIQLTGRANYLAAQQAAGHPYVASPELVQAPEHAALTAAWFFFSNGCNQLADRHQIDAVTRVINGPALAGLVDRRERFEQAMGAFA